MNTTAFRTAAIIPVAGLSSRMGSFKPLMLLDAIPMIRMTVQAALDAGVQDIFVVLGYNEDKIREALKDIDGSTDSSLLQAEQQRRIHYVTNPDYAAKDMLCSVQLGLRALLAHESQQQPFDAAFVLPGDAPAIKPKTFGKLCRQMSQSDYAVCIPTYSEQPGHPVLLARKGFEAVLDYSAEGGLRKASSGLTACFIETDDKGILLDADDTESFQRIADYIRQE